MKTCNQTKAKAQEPKWWKIPRYGIPDEETPFQRIVKNTLAYLLRFVGRKMKRAILLTLWGLGYYANRKDGRPQVTVLYVQQGADVCSVTANKAIKMVEKAIGCTRTWNGYWRVSQEVLEAIAQLVKEYIQKDIFIPPAVERNLSDLPPFDIETTKTRGKTRCPCGCHEHDDHSPSLAYDMQTSLATCQKTRAVFKQPEETEQWVMVRGPYATYVRCKYKKNKVTTNNTHVRQGTERVADRHTAQPLPLRPNLQPSISDPGIRIIRSLHGKFWGNEEIACKGYSACKSLSDMLKWRDKRYNGPVAIARAEVALASTLPGEPVRFPDRLYSLENYEQTYREVLGWDDDADNDYRNPHEYVKYRFINGFSRCLGSRRSVLDLDDLTPLSTEKPGNIDQLVARLDREIRKASGDRLSIEAIVATSNEGMQIIVKWWTWFTDASKLYTGLLREVLERAASAALQIVGRKGKIDRACWTTGRFVRTPGVRIKDGKVVKARLWYAVA